MYAGGERINDHHALFKKVAFSHGVVKHKHFQSTHLGRREGVTKNSGLYAFDNVDNSGRLVTAAVKISVLC